MTQEQTEEDASGQIHDLSKNTDKQNSVGTAMTGRSCPTVEHAITLERAKRQNIIV